MVGLQGCAIGGDRFGRVHLAAPEPLVKLDRGCEVSKVPFDNLHVADPLPPPTTLSRVLSLDSGWLHLSLIQLSSRVPVAA